MLPALVLLMTFYTGACRLMIVSAIAVYAVDTTLCYKIDDPSVLWQ